MTSTARHRGSYHHGDLRNALVAAGAELAAQGGPDAVGIRPAARIVGVTPTAAYRHFADADQLLDAVKDQAFTVLVGAMRDHVADVDTTGSTAEQAKLRLAAIGRAYIEVALAEPGLFRVAFSERGSLPDDSMPEAFQILVDSLDALVESGALAPQRRPMAEIAAWSAVHGFARLVLDGPLGRLTADERHSAAERVIEMVLAAFTPSDDHHDRPHQNEAIG
ncbi:TetR/AcrR family transcriptional regulator [Phytoactinopolyspora halotolerans]|uniref:TetR/AcrR family transcriptional regulator n=1 Tax=Phytoactinopolyspora halotolerans TaxID=1981512 RepID=A0A6L9S436_9ACTN|nr:TetR/AcrR family transcriptional regulator [Phytoactinopolyspora halotolerans]NED98749.1 TetR/AcrR family transcriptional regulator [Phytoactinopolyspora halotolerans]